MIMDPAVVACPALALVLGLTVDLVAATPIAALDELGGWVLGELVAPMSAIIRIVGMALLSGLIALVFAIPYRWYARDRVPRKLAVLVGVSAIALWLNTVRTLSQYMNALDEPFTTAVALTNIGALIAGVGAAVVGSGLGDRLAVRSTTLVTRRSSDGEVGPIVSAVGRVIAVTLPETVGDIDGYDPVDPDVKRGLAGRTFLFPRGLTVPQLRDRLVERLREEHDVGHVDVDVAAAGTIEYLAVGSRVAGLGPTLAPGTLAIAVTADPPPHATPGDAVQLWRAGPSPERVATGELRATTGDVVTVVVDEADIERIEPAASYRLITLSAGSRPEREFASLLRAADETMGVIEIDEDSPLVGTTIEDLEVSIIAVTTPDGAVEGVPPRRHEIRAGEELYAIARPERFRRLHVAVDA